MTREDVAKFLHSQFGRTFYEDEEDFYLSAADKVVGLFLTEEGRGDPWRRTFVVEFPNLKVEYKEAQLTMTTRLPPNPEQAALEFILPTPEEPGLDRDEIPDRARAGEERCEAKAQDGDGYWWNCARRPHEDDEHATYTDAGRWVFSDSRARFDAKNP